MDNPSQCRGDRRTDLYLAPRVAGKRACRGRSKAKVDYTLGQAIRKHLGHWERGELQTGGRMMNQFSFATVLQNNWSGCNDKACSICFLVKSQIERNMVCELWLLLFIDVGQ